MTVENPTASHRDRLIADLRGMADFLDQHPQLPVPRFGPVRVSVHPRYNTADTTETEALAEVERVAALLGVTPQVKAGQHVVAVKLGMTEYEVVLVTQAAIDRDKARNSYRNSISTDPPSES